LQRRRKYSFLWQFIKNATNLLLQQGWHATQKLSVTKSVIGETFDMALA
jgi:hypothetical protein